MSGEVGPRLLTRMENEAHGELMTLGLEPAWPQDPGTWSDDHANGCLRLSGAFGRAADRQLQALDREINRLQALRVEVEAWREKNVSWFEGALQRWFEAHPPAKGKSIRLPYGSCGKKMTSQPVLEIVDEAKALAAAKATKIEGLVRVKEEPSVEGIKRYTIATGHEIEGTLLHPRENRFWVKLSGEAVDLEDEEPARPAAVALPAPPAPPVETAPGAVTIPGRAEPVNGERPGREVTTATRAEEQAPCRPSPPPESGRPPSGDPVVDTPESPLEPSDGLDEMSGAELRERLRVELDALHLLGAERLAFVAERSGIPDPRPDHPKMTLPLWRQVIRAAIEIRAEKETTLLPATRADERAAPAPQADGSVVVDLGDVAQEALAACDALAAELQRLPVEAAQMRDKFEKRTAEIRQVVMGSGSVSKSHRAALSNMREAVRHWVGEPAPTA